MIDEPCPPAWSLLTAPSMAALLKYPKGGMPEAISIRPSLNPVEVADAALVATTRLMIERAIAEGRLTLTATGALSRADTRAIFDAMSWPAYDKAHLLEFNKVLNEADVRPVEVTRLLAQTAKLLRRRDRRLHATTVAKRLVGPGQGVDLFRLLFATMFWQVNLAYFDRVPIAGWPQSHFGLVLWSLSVAVERWTMPAPLMPVCTAYDEAFEDHARDFPEFAFESRALRPLTWFGLMETRSVGEDGAPEWRKDRQYRKAPLFDRALTFDVEMIRPSGPSH